MVNLFANETQAKACDYPITGVVSNRMGFMGLLLGILLTCNFAYGAQDKLSPPTLKIKSFRYAGEAEHLIAAALKIAPDRRVPFISGYFLGRKYRAETKKWIKEQRTKPKTKKEATNKEPIPLPLLITSMDCLDCMTYVEHVLAFASSVKPDYKGEFLPRLIDLMFDGNGQPLMNHNRDHFTSQWGDINERKGYLTNLARNHPAAATRTVILNKVGNNRTFYVEDRFTIASSPQVVHFFPLDAVLSGKAPLASGDVLAMVCDKEGLDVTHMGFFIEQGGKKYLRHASFTLNKIVDQDFEPYLRGKKELKGLMIFRPRFNAKPPAMYKFSSVEK